MGSPTAELQTGPEGEQRGTLLEHGGHLVVDGVHLGADGGEPGLFLQVSHGKPCLSKREPRPTSHSSQRRPKLARRRLRAQKPILYLWLSLSLGSALHGSIIGHATALLYTAQSLEWTWT